ncbi:MAG: RNA polymerase sigma factor [Ruminococcus sp.]|nr:RNA polymerase sigma factor [Ruminococcus sp.]
MHSDFLLIRRMKQGEEEAFDLFVHKYYKEILAYCGYRCSDKEYAEDITQETFVRFFAKLSDYNHRGKTKNYLYTIAGNLCKDYFKKIKDIPVEESELSTRIEFVEHPMENVLNKLTVEWALKQLPNELSEVVTLYYFQELKLTEIADILHISVPLVKYRLKQAKMRLGKLFQEEGSYESGRTTYDL